MHAPTRLEICMLATLVAWPVVQAQSENNPPGKTLGDLIRQSKRQQAQNLRGAPEPLMPVMRPVKAKRADENEMAKPPLLWSLVGVDQKLVAEVIYEQRVLVVKLDEGDRQIGPWVIDRYDTQGLQLSARGSGSLPKKLWLAVPAQGASVAQFATALHDTSAKVQPVPSSDSGATDSTKALLSQSLPPPPVTIGKTP